MKERKTGYYLAKGLGRVADGYELGVVYIDARFPNRVGVISWETCTRPCDYNWIAETPLDLETLCDNNLTVPDYIEKGLSDVK